MRILSALFLAFWPVFAAAQDHSALVERAIEAHILPGYADLSAKTEALAAVSEAFCVENAPIEALDSAYHDAFDAWIGVSHLRFGPSEAEDRAFAIAFWPDARGFTPRALGALIRDEAPAVNDPAAFAEVSVAARGLFALDFLLFDPDREGVAADAAAYSCRLLRAITADVAANAAAIEADWRGGYAAMMTTPGPENPLYASPAEASAEIFGALASGLEAVIDLRLGRPLGTFDRPRPRRAEAWRSGRAQRNLVLSLAALAQLSEAAFLPELAPEDADAVRAAFDRALEVAARIEPPLAEAVAEPSRRLGVEAARTTSRDALQAVDEGIGGALGLEAGFNSLDGD